MVCPVCVTPPYCCLAYAAIHGTVVSGAESDIALISKEKMSELTVKLKAKRSGRKVEARIG